MFIKRLKVLDLTGNALNVIPNEMGQFAMLEELILSDNNLGYKSKETGCAAMLKSLG